jgi:hypothetical protein
MQTTFEQTRGTISATVDGLNGAVLNEILDASHQIDDMVQQIVAAVDAASDQECAAQANDGGDWGDDIAFSGQELSQCSQLADISAEALPTAVFYILEEAQRQSVTVQNIVVNGFIDWNPLEPVAQLSAIIDGRLNGIETEFNQLVAEELRVGLEGITETRSEIEAAAEACLARAVEQLMMNGNAILMNLQEC